MDTNSQLNRPVKYALLSAGAAGLIATIMIAGFIDMLNFLFVPAVMIMVFVSAYFAFRRQMRNKGALTSKRIFVLAAEVGTLSHFYTFALYFPLIYFTESMEVAEPDLTLELIGSYIISSLIGGLISLIFFFWLSIPMYMAVGHIVKAMEGEQFPDPTTLDESIFDDVLVETELDALD